MTIAANQRQWPAIDAEAGRLRGHEQTCPTDIQRGQKRTTLPAHRRLKQI